MYNDKIADVYFKKRPRSFDNFSLCNTAKYSCLSIGSPRNYPIEINNSFIQFMEIDSNSALGTPIRKKISLSDLIEVRLCINEIHGTRGSNLWLETTLVIHAKNPVKSCISNGQLGENPEDVGITHVVHGEWDLEKDFYTMHSFFLEFLPENVSLVGFDLIKKKIQYRDHYNREAMQQVIVPLSICVLIIFTWFLYMELSIKFF